MAKQDEKPTPSASATAAPLKANYKAAGGGPSSLTLLSAFVALVALAVSGVAYSKPTEFQQFVGTARTRVLTALDQFQAIVDASPSLDCGIAEQYLTEFGPVQGFHVLCVKKTTQETLSVVAYKDGMQPKRLVETALDLTALKKDLELLLEVPQRGTETADTYKQPHAFFTPQGKRLEQLSEMANSVVFFFEGGQFIWPGIKLGHKTIVQNVTGKGEITLETLSMVPLVFGVEEFLKDDEIDVIMDMSLEHLQPSAVKPIDGDENRPATDWRTSTTYFLKSDRHAMLAEIDQRTADLTKVPVSHQEDVQVLRYEKTQKYDQHLDYFAAEHYQKSPDVLRSIEYGAKNRMITVFWYMSDVAKGGHTIFPRAGGKPQPPTFNDCTKGLKVPPRKRKVVVFYSMLPNGEGDPMSLHGGCPVEEGTKYSGNKWVWNKPYEGSF